MPAVLWYPTCSLWRQFTSGRRAFAWLGCVLRVVYGTVLETLMLFLLGPWVCLAAAGCVLASASLAIRQALCIDCEHCDIDCFHRKL